MSLPKAVLHWIATFPILSLILLLASCGGSSSGSMTPPPPPAASNSPFWAQWGSTAQHSGSVSVAAQGLNRQLADIIYDPFVAQEQAEFSGDLVAHYQATLTDGNDFYMESKSGSYPSCTPVGDWQNGTACGPNAWDKLVWNVTRYTWESGKPVVIWTFVSDWKPEPNVTNGLGGWEPVFHPVLANSFIYVPGAGGTVYKVDKNTGRSVKQIDPFAAQAVDKAHTYVSGPLAADASGNVYYNVLGLADPGMADPWFVADASGAWLVKVNTSDIASIVTYASLVPGAPPAGGPTVRGLSLTYRLGLPSPGRPLRPMCRQACLAARSARELMWRLPSRRTGPSTR